MSTSAVPAIRSSEATGQSWQFFWLPAGVGSRAERSQKEPIGADPLGDRPVDRRNGDSGGVEGIEMPWKEGRAQAEGPVQIARPGPYAGRGLAGKRSPLSLRSMGADTATATEAGKLTASGSWLTVAAITSSVTCSTVAVGA